MLGSFISSAGRDQRSGRPSAECSRILRIALVVFACIFRLGVKLSSGEAFVTDRWRTKRRASFGDATATVTVPQKDKR